MTDQDYKKAMLAVLDDIKESVAFIEDKRSELSPSEILKLQLRATSLALWSARYDGFLNAGKHE